MLRDFCVEFAGNEFTCVDKGFSAKEFVQVVVRPEDIRVKPAIQGQLTGIVENVILKACTLKCMFVRLDMIDHSLYTGFSSEES